MDTRRVDSVPMNVPEIPESRPIAIALYPMEKYTRERTQLLDWIETNREIKARANENFTNTDYAFKLYNQAHPDYKLTQPTKPKF